MVKKFSNFICRRVFCLILAAAVVLPLLPALPVNAYLQGRHMLRGREAVGINLMFDNLTADALAEYQSRQPGLELWELEWGKRGNPFVISNDRHLQNLYILQNGGNIETGSHFLVCRPDGTPAAVGGQDGTHETIQPVGTHEYPFQGTISGAFRAGNAVLSSGETVNGSAIDGVTIDGSGKVDIGFFGMVGPGAKVENLIFSNVQLRAGGNTPRISHTYYKDVKAGNRDPQETNHIGIIAGHVDHATMKDLSVYYSSNQVQAMDLSSGDPANYLCGTGFFGLLDGLNPNDKEGGYDNDDFGTSGEGGGGDDYGNNPGYIRAEQLFELRPAKDANETTTQLMDLEENGKNKVRKSSDQKYSRHYIYDGVFAISLSRGQDDSIMDLWEQSSVQQPALLYAPITRLWTPKGGSLPGQENSAPDPAEQPEAEQPDVHAVEVMFSKEPADLELSVFSISPEGEKIPSFSIAEMENRMAEEGRDPASLDLSSLQSIKTWDKNNVYLLTPGVYFAAARRQGYEPMEARSFTVDERSDAMKIQIQLLPEMDDPTEPETTETTAPEETAAPETTEETILPDETAVPDETTAETAAPEEVPGETEPVPGEEPAPIETAGLYRIPSRASALPELYFGTAFAAPDEQDLQSGSAESIPPLETEAVQGMPEENQVPGESIPDVIPQPEAEDQQEQNVPEPLMQQVQLILADEIAGTAVSVTDQNGNAVPPAAPDTPRRYLLRAGEAYTYIAACDGYIPAEGTFIPQTGDEVQTVSVPALEKGCRLAFQADPAESAEKGLKITLRHGSPEQWNSETDLPSVKDQPLLYFLPEGTYCYQVSCPGYEAGPVTQCQVTGQDTVIPISLDLKAEEPILRSVNFHCSQDDLQLEIWSQQGRQGNRFLLSPETGSHRTAQLPVGETCYYSASLQGFAPLVDQPLTVDPSLCAVEVTLRSEKPLMTPFGSSQTVTFVCKPQDMSLQVYRKTEGAQEPVMPTEVKHDQRIYQLEPGQYFYTASRAGFEALPEKTFQVKAGKTPRIQVTLKSGESFKQKKYTIHCTPADLQLQVWSIVDGQKLVYQGSGTGAERTYQLYPSSVNGKEEVQYHFRAEAPGYFPLQGRLNSFNEWNNTPSMSITLEEQSPELGNIPIPDSGPNAPPDEMLGNKGTDQIILSKQWEYRPVPTKGKYALYLQKVTDLNQLYYSPDKVANTRYFICPKGYEGINPGAFSYLSLITSGEEAYVAGNFTAVTPTGAGVIKPPENWQKPAGSSYQGTGAPSLIMEFSDYASRSQAIETMGLQIQRIGAKKFHIFQSAYAGGSWEPQYFFGLGSVQGSGTLLYRTKTMDLSYLPGFGSDIFDITLQGSGGDWQLWSSNGNNKVSFVKQHKQFNSSWGDINDFDIYQVSAFDIIPSQTEERWVPVDEKPVKLDADQYALYQEPERTDATHVQTTRTPYGPGAPAYQLLSWEELGNRGWQTSAGERMSAAYKPTKRIVMRETLLKEGDWSGEESQEVVIHLPLKKGEKEIMVPLGTVSFFVNEMKANSFVRMIVATPTIEKPYSGSDPINRLGVWQVSSGYWHYNARAAMPVPVSQPLSQNDQDHYIQVSYQGETYKSYLQGERLLAATEVRLDQMHLLTQFTASNGQKCPGPFFMLQTYNPMQLIYCAAEGIADGNAPGGDPDSGNKKLGNIDFVYQQNGTVIPVTHPGLYQRSNVLFRFENLAPGMPKINSGTANLHRTRSGETPHMEGIFRGEDSAHMNIIKGEKPQDTVSITR